MSEVLPPTSGDAIQWVSRLIKTAIPSGRSRGPTFRVGVIGDRQMAVLLLGPHRVGLDVAGIDQAIEALTEAKTILEADTPKGADHEVHLD